MDGSAGATGPTGAAAESPADSSAGLPTGFPADIHTWSAGRIAASVQAGELRAVDVVRAHLARIERLNPQLEAFRVIRREQALAEASAVDAHAERATLPLAGVPVAIKDNVEVAGEMTGNGSGAGSSEPATVDHPVVVRLRAAGAVVVGVTNVPELCLTPMSDSVHGVPRNPWKLARTPGGSSGGSAAAVAAGLVPLAHGNDGLGSIRIPAACCGLVGIKPGSGVVPPSIDATPVWDGLSDHGPLATTVQDAALCLSVMGADSSLATLDSPERLRVGLSLRQTQVGLPIDRRYTAATTAVSVVLESCGHTVSAHRGRYPSWQGTGALRSWFSFAWSGSRPLEHARLDKRTRRMAAVGRILEALHADGARARAKWRSGAADAFFGDFDVLLLPALAQPAPSSARWGQRGLLRNTYTCLRVASLLSPWNLAGWPAMSVPAGVDEQGMPIGVQLVARPGGERLLLSLAAQLESARPWQRQAPGWD
ncbi:amidase [Actinospica durhamensis]|uniref:Amidase n=1 Tax=Actinospica durhamensis TaxID=1508375 RepID=A0A941EPI5_9ACTN|nr:amidase [Actinospica durhamensis]MBR7834743.1 amidase [Actinospica durhamensis]